MRNLARIEATPVQGFQIESRRYAKCREVSRRVRWDIDRDVIRGRVFDFSTKFLPDGFPKCASSSS